MISRSSSRIEHAGVEKELSLGLLSEPSRFSPSGKAQGGSLAESIPRNTSLWLLSASRTQVALIGAALLALTFTIDVATGREVSVGVLYVLPIMVWAVAFSEVEVIFLSVTCAILRIYLVDTLGPLDSLLRGLLSLAAFAGSGLFVVQLVNNERLSAFHLRELQAETRRRIETEEQLRVLAESSPAAIFTIDAEGRMLSANEATRRLFGIDPGSSLEGLQVDAHLPVLAGAVRMPAGTREFRTSAQSQGTRVNGDLFVAQTWFSTYQSPSGRRLAAIAVDCSDEVREREEQNLHRLLENNRIIAGAVAHEIRNVCGAVSVVHSNLQRVPELRGNEDFAALGSLVEALERIASVELEARVKHQNLRADLREVLNSLNVVIRPNWSESDASLRWDVPEHVPRVAAEPFGLLQAFLNLAENSLRAVQDSEVKELRVSLSHSGGFVAVLFEDSGPGVAAPERLFEPFQQGAKMAGLGLFVSRAILRSYGGDLRYEPAGGQCRFTVYLRTAEEPHS